MAIEQRLLDKRVIRRNLAQAKVDPVEYRQLLDALPDRSDRVITREDESRADGADGSE